MRQTSPLLLVLAAACGTASEPAPAPVVEAPAPDAQISALIKEQMRAGGLPAVSVAVIAKDEVKWTRAFGFADIDARKVADPDTIFVVASVSKTVVGEALMQLVDDGKLDLDVPLETYLPYAVRHPDHPEVEITARMLITHTSGLNDDWIELGSASQDGDSPVTLREFAQGYVTPGGRYYGMSWGAKPGTRRSYCNAAFGVVGDLVETVAGKTLPALSKERIFGPLGMTSTGWHLGDLDASRLAVPYGGTWDDFIATEHQGYAFYPATGLRTTAGDMARFVHAVMRYGELDGHRVMSEPTARSMRDVPFPEIDRDQALIWSWDTVEGRRVLEHSGSTVGGAAIVRIDPENQTGIVLLTNSDAYIRSRFGMREGAVALAEIAKALEAHARSF